MTDAPGPISPTSTETISGLYTESFLPAGPPKGIVVITHGYAEHCGRYHEVAHVIVNAGWAVLSYDVRGHGKSPGERGYIDRFSTYLGDFAAMQAAARERIGATAPMVLLGHSHGSLIVLRALCDDRPPDAVAAIVTSPYLAPKMVIPGYKKLLARVASRIAPNLAQPNQLKSTQFTHDPQKQAEADADTQNFKIATARWFTESSTAQQYVAKHASKITIPTTWLVGGADPIADPAASRRVASTIKGAQYHDLSGMLHEVMNEVDRGKVFAEVTKTLAACGAARA